CRPRARRKALVLVVVLVVVTSLSLGALAFSLLMVGEREVAQAAGRRIQALALAESGIEAARQLLGEQPDARSPDGTWFENAERFQGVLILDGETPQDRGRFSIVAADGGEMRFGLECESSKLNLNTILQEGGDAAAARQRLMVLPDMTEEIADAILDWIDADDEQREFGAEADYYQSLDVPYRPSNGPLRCLEELLLVRGVTPQLLYGADRNRNGLIDADESALDAQPGWVRFLTLFSRESNLNPDGEPKIDLNQDDAETLYAQLCEAFDEEWAVFIVGYRQQEELYEDEETPPAEQNPPAGEESDSNRQRDENEEEEEEIEYQDRPAGQLDLTKPLNQKLDSPLDLIGRKIKVNYQESEKAAVVSPLFADQSEAMREYLPKLFELATTEGENPPAGRINLNLAPIEVLSGVPDVDASLAEEIVARRPAAPALASPHHRHPTWLLIDGVVPLDKMKALLPRLTAGGCVYRAQAVGFFDEGGAVIRLAVVIDAGESPPRIVSVQDMTPFGRGFDLPGLGAQP
ncbi:MAG: general secretion pathway protein GspK, partial [Pirellulaceae bacterium]|nr:general secretion pathway protein GspK [Pirellulaceae bacterium]